MMRPGTILVAGGVVLAALALRSCFNNAARPSAQRTPRPAAHTSELGALKGQHVKGRAVVHDGDTLRVYFAGQKYYKIRVFGIDAPELEQNCVKDKATIACGKISRDFLISLVDGKDVDCFIKTVDRRRRLVGVCAAPDGKDITETMIAAGMGIAYAYTRYDGKYVKQFTTDHYLSVEANAKKAHAGIWAMQFDPPNHWRQCHLPQYKVNRPSDCVPNARIL